jgi:predicted acylesterase/phospholipase RssA
LRSLAAARDNDEAMRLLLFRGSRPLTDDHPPEPAQDTAIVLSGGSVNGVLMELGFLRRVRETSLWPRVGWIFGTSAGALSGCMAALDRLDDLERFLLELRPEETFRPNRLWRLPLLGLHDYALPRTIEERLGDPVAIARDLAAAERELVVVATDVTSASPAGDDMQYELVYSSKETPPEEMMQAILASAAISALVLPVRVGERIATDGAWVRNFPLCHAYDRDEVRRIVAFRYMPKYPQLGVTGLQTLRKRLSRFERVPPIRAFIAELREAEERDRRGEPAHQAEMLVRLNRAAIMRNMQVEEETADQRDASIRELERLEADVLELVRTHVPRSARSAVAGAVAERFRRAAFPFRRQRAVRRITVRGTVGEVSLEPGLRRQQPWTVADKRSIIARGYELAEQELRAAGIDVAREAEPATATS